MIQGFDIFFFRALNEWAFFSPVLDAVAFFFAVFVVMWMITGVFALAALAYLPRYHHVWKKNVFLALAALAAALVARFGAIEFIRFFYSRPRPFEVLHDASILLFREGGGSFPSGHAAFSFALAAVIWRAYPKLGVVFYAAATILSLSRIFVGVHWPTDILGGAFIGIGVGFAIDSLVRKFFKAKTTPRGLPSRSSDSNS